MTHEVRKRDWFQDELRRRDRALVSVAVPVGLVLVLFLVSPTYISLLLRSQPVVLLGVVLLFVLAVRLAWADIPTTEPHAGIGPARAWAIVAAIAAIMLAALAVLLAMPNSTYI